MAQLADISPIYDAVLERIHRGICPTHHELQFIHLPDGTLKVIGANENPAIEALATKDSKVGAKQKNITAAGLITDRSSGEALPFVSVRVVGTAIGVTANVNGQFTLLHVPTDTSALIFKY